MKLHEVLTEQQDISVEVAEQVVEHCSPYLQAVNVDDVILWRGMKPQGPYQHKQVRKDRQPLDTHPAIQYAADQFFEQKFGIPLRSSSLFVVKSARLAAQFGEEHLIYPTSSSWRFFGSKTVSDFTAYVNKHLHDDYSQTLHRSKIAKSKWQNNVPPELSSSEYKIVEQAVSELLEQADYKELSIQDLQNFTQEIMLVTDSYFAVHPGKIDPLSFNENLKQMLTGQTG